MADYILTDTELTSVANAIRSKGGTSAQIEWPYGFVSAIQAIPEPAPEIVSWASGTDVQIAAMVSALDNGILTIADTGWQIGDERTVHLSAMPATNVSETHAEQDVVFVLVDSQHFDLVGGGKDHFVVAMKNCLAERGYMNDAADGNAYWEGCKRRAWCNNEFRDAIPSTLRSCFKQFICKAASADLQSVISSEDYFALFAAKEYCYNLGTSGEQNALQNISYYSTQSNRAKTGTRFYDYYTRSRRDTSSFAQFLGISLDGSINQYGGSTTEQYNLSPFGCI